jgi:alkylhydroperoxidase family enzyme
LQQLVGLVPNLAATMAHSPALVSSFVGALGAFAKGSFSGAERQVLLLANAVTNRSAWAVAFHSTAALREGVPPAEVAALREGRAPADRRLAALAATTRAFIERRGHLEEREIAAFLDAGFAPAQLLEILAGLACSTMANLAGNVTRPPLEAPFEAQRWSPPA